MREGPMGWQRQAGKLCQEFSIACNNYNIMGSSATLFILISGVILWYIIKVVIKYLNCLKQTDFRLLCILHSCIISLTQAI
jgi:hypothetical protein